jgi:hypothetical protein
VLSGDADAADFVKELFDREGSVGAYDKETRKAIKKWLTYNSPYFSSDLARLAGGAGDAGEYVSNQEELLALTRVDFDKAQPIIDRLYSRFTKTSRGAYGAYARCLRDLPATSTVPDELKAIVEDKQRCRGCVSGDGCFVGKTGPDATNGITRCSAATLADLRGWRRLLASPR